MDKLDLYYIDLKYIRNLSNADDNVMSISPQRGKEKRPFVGVIVLVNGTKYCIPLTSPKDKFKAKKSQIDFVKIFDIGRRDENNQYKLIGVLNINNMIPVEDGVIKKVVLTIHKEDSPEIRRSKILMQKQLDWCRSHADVIANRAQKVYDLVVNTPNKNVNLTKRSSKFKVLELELYKYLGYPFA
ncbi:MAG: type III toxin-antitoxin system ToxN/AbiQ family toxin [Lachnospiraceae bacterium]|nr:type III toxin-antitoxin system ToxN/AbiQ family toxin [Candidatus Merdinaster equi]